MIYFFYEDCSSLNKKLEKKLEKTSQLIEKEVFKLGDISFIFCSDDYLLSLNK